MNSFPAGLIALTASGPTGALQLTERSAQGFDFLFIRGLLAFGLFSQFQHFLHLIQHVFQRFDDLRNLINRLTDGGTAWLARRGKLTCDLGHRFKQSRLLLRRLSRWR